MGLRTTAGAGPYTGAATPGTTTQMSTNLDAMVSAQRYVEDVAGMLYGEIQRLMTTVDTLSGHWRSPSASQYNNAMDNWNTTATELKNSLDNIADGLSQSHKKYNENEENNKLGITQAASGLSY